MLLQRKALCPLCSPFFLLLKRPSPKTTFHDHFQTSALPVTNRFLLYYPLLCLEGSWWTLSTASYALYLQGTSELKRRMPANPSGWV